ncbi:MAG TPA: ChbG/HpnK family deacetylase [Candidatus Acidoferrales bacterium]|nr:ChbG/HpnK family deacetylase [Candidatus Acidoferrales bacterium]
MKELILNADDFGYTRGVNEGIIRAHKDGILTSATLMANGPAFDDAVERAKANPSLGVGCHLVLTGGTAVAPSGEIPSLATRDGRLPESLGALVARLSSGSVRTRHIEIELRAQIEKIRRAGIEPTHLDTHKHTHVHPRVMSALGRVAREFGITRVRNPVESLEDSWRTARAERAGIVLNLVASSAVRAVSFWFRAISRTSGLRYPDRFLGLAATGHLGGAALCRMIDTLAEARTEIMLHPGVCDAELARTGSRLQWQRGTEMEGLLSAEASRAVKEKGIRLISYRELS